MASYDKFDRRLESLVVETHTTWGPDVEKELSVEDRRTIAEAIQRQPELASKISYERAHTGFTRQIEVTADDIARLYAAKFGN